MKTLNEVKTAYYKQTAHATAYAHALPTPEIEKRKASASLIRLYVILVDSIK